MEFFSRLEILDQRIASAVAAERSPRAKGGGSLRLTGELAQKLPIQFDSSRPSVLYPASLEGSHG